MRVKLSNCSCGKYPTFMLTKGCAYQCSHCKDKITKSHDFEFQAALEWNDISQISMYHELTNKEENK